MDYSHGEFVIRTNGYYWKEADHVDVNDSGIWNRLIQEAGRKCDFYASDLLIDYDSYKRDLPEFVKRGEGYEWAFGFRSMGVDSKSMIESGYERAYISRFNLTLSIDEVQVSSDYVSFNLELRRVA
jgi:hypothetical protein